MFKRKLIALALAVMASSGASSAFAGTATGTMLSSATLTSACSLTITNVAFGSLSGLLTTAATATGALNVSCSKSTAYSVAINNGMNNIASGATVATRVLENLNSDKLSYNLYQDSAYATVWGYTTGTGGNVVTGSGTGTVQALTVYAQIPAGQAVPPGTFTDSLIATITY